MRKIITTALSCTGLPRHFVPRNDVTIQPSLRAKRGNPETEKKTGFTLIELLISLIIISLITSAFVPMLSKKLKHTEASYSAVKPMKIDCTPYDTTDGSCLLCNEKECNLCTSSINVADGYFVNPVQTCNRQSCTKIHAQCKKCTKDGCQECNVGYKLNPSTKLCEQVKCNKGYKVVGSSCVKCDANTIQANDNSTAVSCSSCSDSQISNEERSACVNVTCNAGQYRNGRACYNCSPGNFQPNNNSTATSCTSCASKTLNCTSCDAQSGICSACKTGFPLTGGKCNTITFSYTGGVQTWNVPSDGTFKLEVWGAQGGTINPARGTGGLGGYAQGKIALRTNHKLFIYVGGMGNGVNGGFNGAAHGGTCDGTNCAGGGGASDVRLDPVPERRIIIAGGGGGAGGSTHIHYDDMNFCMNGGSGGGSQGGKPTNANGNPCNIFHVSSSCSLHQIEEINYGKYISSLGGGGGGLCNGNHEMNEGGGNQGMAGGGGSGYIGGVSEGSMQNGVRSGHGQVVITQI